MRSTSLSIADKVSPAMRAVYHDVHGAARLIGADCLLVGATARDMVYEAAFGLDIKRATADIDFAIRVDTWDTFAALTNSLVDRYGFSRTDSEHRLNLPGSQLWIDIIPFGAIADKDGKYRWPNDPDIEISILGFQEALESAITCQVSVDPKLQLKIVHPAVLVMLKIFSWRDRRRYKTADAQDAAYAMSYYIRLDDNEQRLYDEPELFEGEFDFDTIGARLTGRDLARLVPGDALSELRTHVQEEIDSGDQSRLLADMMVGSPGLFVDERLYGHLLPNLALGIDEA